ncbi:MAG TPA: heme lyase CcmF/NrfE family subunit [Candidatus Sulfotelmatobacter sp.]|nr:heme lyase CcmF/NrfE family subunit [Candidatus Sulfotelmatobacter sp.]
MISTLGGFVLFLALGVSVYSLAACLAGARPEREEWLASGRNGILAAFCLITIAMALLEYALLTSDFSLRYVANNSTRASLARYKVAGLWGSLEGSILLWAWLQSLFASLVAARYVDRHRALMPYVLAILQGILTFFLLVMVAGVNPFAPLVPVPADGRGLNPLLEVTDMLIHPLLLYLGYVGFSVPFAFAMAALITGRLSEEWLTITRRWTIVAWLFLTGGIFYGGWWSYRTLGWGGYWAWDPVENASFMPWLTGTAFIHSVMIQERKRMLKVWNLVLVTVTFGLVIFGTFLTRSGILGSVHAFADGPVGILFLGFLALVLLFSLSLVAYRSDRLRGHGELDSLVSRESAFLLNNVVLVGICFTVFLGTIFPLLAEAVRGNKMSVGAPYFNRVSAPLGLALLLLMGIGPLIAWGRASLDNLKRNFLKPVLLAAGGTGILVALGVRGGLTLLAFFSAFFVLASVGLEFLIATRTRARSAGEGALTAFLTLLLRSRRRYGGLIVHLGVVVAIIGIAVSSVYKVEREETLTKGATLTVGHYTLRFDGLAAAERPTHILVWANLAAFRDGKPVAELTPGQRFYPNQQSPFASVDARYHWSEDLYLVLSSFERDGSSATIKAFVNPMISWIWIGGAIILMGVVVAVLPERRLALLSVRARSSEEAV